MRRAIALIAAAAVASISAGCATTGGSAEGEVKDSLTFALNADPASLDLIYTTDQAGHFVWWSLYDTLLLVNEETKEVEPNLAKEWTFNEDGTELTLKLEEDVTFHNGEPLKASDVVFTLDRDRQSPQIGNFLGTYESSEAVDDHTVVLKFSKPYAPILSSLALVHFGIVNEKAVTEAASPEEYAQHPIGTGPYKFESRVSGDRIDLTAHENYWRGPAPIKKLTYKVHTDSSSAVVALESGELDIMAFVPVTDKKHIESVESLTWYEAPYSGLVQVIFNNAEGRFADQNLREAVAHAVDRESIIAGAIEGEGSPVQSIFTPPVFGHDPSLQNRPYDLEKAREFMAAAGYPDGLDVTVTTFQSATYSTVVEILQAQLAEIGIRLEIRKVEKPVFLEEIISNHDFEISTIVWGADTLDSDFFWDILHSSSSKNFSEINLPEVDALLDEARVNIDPEARKAAYSKAGQLLIDKVTMVPLFNFNQTLAANAKLKGVKPSSKFVHRVWEYSW